MYDLDISEPIDIILCDGNPIVLSAMSETFEEDSRFSLVATSGTSEGFLTTILRIDVQLCIIDWNIRDLGAEKLIDVLRSQSIPPRTIIYGDGSDPDIARQAMGAGAGSVCIPIFTHRNSYSNLLRRGRRQNGISFFRCTGVTQ
jgi:two-component system nitrate/nitrite response regulator NarP